MNKFKIGDKVEVIDSFFKECVGLTATVVFIEDNTVKIDFGIDLGNGITHTLNKRLKGNTGRSFNKNKLKLINTFVVELI